MKKIIRLITAAVLAFGIVFGVSGCSDDGSATSNSVSNEWDYRFNIQEYRDIVSPDEYTCKVKIIIDTETGVQYMYYKEGSGHSSTAGLTPLLNADGTPMLVEGYEYDK